MVPVGAPNDFSLCVVDAAGVCVTKSVRSSNADQFCSLRFAFRIVAIETGGCPHAAIREDISANLMACETLTARYQTDIVLIESGGGMWRSVSLFIHTVPGG